MSNLDSVVGLIALAIIIAGCTAGSGSMGKTATGPAAMPSTGAAPTTVNQTVKPRAQAAEQFQTTTISEIQPQKGRQRVVETQWQGVTVELTSIEPASGEMLMVKFTYVNRGSAVADFRMKDIYYVDTRNRRKYAPVGDGVRLLASVDRGYRRVEIAPGRSTPHWIKFSVPPAGVERIDLYFPGALPMENVPIR